MSISRRDFLGTAAAATAVPHLLAAPETNAKGMPLRAFGKTGAKVTYLAFGCGSRFLGYKDEDEADRVLHRAIDLGIGYIDTAAGYGNGASETRVGRVMKTRRKEVFLATKISNRKADDAMRRFEESLRLLNTDYVDVVHIHALGEEDDLAAIEAPDGVLKAMYKIRDQKMARFIGITCHQNPKVLAKALERHDFNATQMALNAALAGQPIPGSGQRGLNRMPKGGFQDLALPIANRKGMGVIAMKVFGQDMLKGEATPEELIRYSLSLPISAAVVGMPQVSMLEENVQIAKAFAPFDAERMRQLSTELSTRKQAQLESFFANHVDA
jgi:aryl-alcohol dehydrogenase-like predicted oxidoreductase